MLLFFLCIVIVFILIFLAIRFSSIRFTVINLDINTTEKEIINDYQFEFGIYLFNKVKILKYKINERKINKIMNSKILKKLSNKDFKKITLKLEKKVLIDIENRQLVKDIKKLIKNIKPEIFKFKLKLKIGLGDVIFTTFMIPIISSIISCVLNKGSINLYKKNSKQKYYFKIDPEYNKIAVKLKLNCIINVKMVHIINIIYALIIKKRRSDKYERTSYRRSYGYSHE